MTAVRSVDSFKYGARLFAYLLVVLVVGSGLLGLGGAIAYSDARALLGSGGYSSTELAGGAVLVALGAFVLLAGLFGLVHKLIADSVAAGQPADQSTIPSPAETAEESTDEQSQSPDSTADDETADQTGPSPGEQAARDHGTTQTVPAGTTAEPDPPEPTPPAEPSEATAERPTSASKAGSDTAESQPSTAPDTGNEPTEAQPTDSQPKDSAQTETQPTASASESEANVAADDPVTTQQSDERPDDWTSELEFPARESQSETATKPAETGTTPETDSTDEPVDASETDDEPAEQPRPEPSPEEIAFGTSSEPDEESADDPEAGDDDEEEEDEGQASYEELEEESSSVEPAGNPSAGDPLADPNDDK